MDVLYTVFQSLRIQDILDILIIATLIYILLIWFKRTASRFVFVGISLLGVVYIIARIFHLYLTSMVLQGFFAILVIVLVVIFQEDIRRFFERIALWRSLRKPLSKGEQVYLNDDVKILVESVAEFASKRIGALIVIPGSEPLDRHLKGGYNLNGELSQPLLSSIFDTHSIGHDGAVIIDKSHVIKFGCHLPLSLDTKKFGRFGLRHTAAIGLSERSDSLCIVVSEERGTISVAREGKIRVVTNPTELNSILRHFYEEKLPAPRKKIVSHWVRRNTAEKAVAVLLAIGLWAVFGYQKESVQRDYVVQIEYRKVSSQEWGIEETRRKEATVTLMGSPQAFDLFDPATLKISVDLSVLQEGRQDIILTRDMIRIPSNLSVVNFQPEQIQINAYKLYTIDSKLEPKTTGSLPPQFVLKSITISPEKISVLGPYKFIKNTNIIKSEPVDLSTITQSATFDTKIILPSEMRFKNGQNPSVKVTVEVEQKVEQVQTE
ncbi:MAG: diadenylate cyclase [Deltaproteobacteria bacterium]|nr:diadenylate cyclase [Deltaproteobacteria bacterium]